MRGVAARPPNADVKGFQRRTRSREKVKEVVCNTFENEEIDKLDEVWKERKVSGENVVDPGRRRLVRVVVPESSMVT